MKTSTLGNARLSSRRAGQLVRQIIPHRHLQVVLASLARSVQIANETSPEKWGLRLNSRSIMLKVGFVEVVHIVGDTFHFLVEKHLVPDWAKQRFRIYPLHYKNARNCNGCDVDLPVSSRAFRKLLPAHEAAIRIAARGPRRADIPKDHSAGLIKFLSQELNFRLPQPAHHAPQSRIPEEIPWGSRFYEGAKTTVTVNRYERDPKVRACCIQRWGLNCSACGSSLDDKYGPQVFGLIHVHHLQPLAKRGKKLPVDPIKDLRPVCPNCHAVIHSADPPRTIEEVKHMLRISARLH